MEDYLITHLGEGMFKVKMENDEIKEVGSSLCGMIRYSYKLNGKLYHRILRRDTPFL